MLSVLPSSPASVRRRCSTRPTRPAGRRSLSKNPNRGAAAVKSSSVVLFPQPALQLIYDAAPIGLACLSPDCRYLQINQRLTEICGISVEDHLGRSVRDCVPALARSDHEQLSRTLRTGTDAVTHAFPDGRAGAIDIKVLASGKDDVRIVFCDDGCGMSRSVRRKACDLFFTTRRDKGGTGLVYTSPTVSSQIVWAVGSLSTASPIREPKSSSCYRASHPQRLPLGSADQRRNTMDENDRFGFHGAMDVGCETAAPDLLQPAQRVSAHIPRRGLRGTGGVLSACGASIRPRCRRQDCHHNQGDAEIDGHHASMRRSDLCTNYPYVAGETADRGFC